MNEKGVIERFDGRDFSVWAAKIEAFLDSKEIGDVLVAKAPTAEGAEKKAFLTRDRQARSLLLLSLDNKQAKTVLRCTTSKEMMDKLKAIHQQKSAASKLNLQKEFHDLRMNTEENVQDYISRAEFLYGQLQDIGVDNINEATLVTRIVTGLPKRFVNFMSNWNNLDEGQQTLINLLPRLMAEDTLLNKFKKTESLALYNESSHKNGFKKGNYDKRTDSRNTKPKLATSKEFRCFNCQGRNHLARNCKKPRQDAEGSRQSVAMIVEANMAKAEDDEVWLLDSASTDHMTYERSFFNEYATLDPPRMIRSLTDKHVGKGVGIGTVPIVVMIDGQKQHLLLKDVLHVPDSRRNLVSVAKATSLGYTGRIEGDRIVLIDSKGINRLIAKSHNNLYKIVTEVQSRTEANIANVDDLTLWHERLAHVNKQTILKMARLSSAIGLSGISASKEYLESLKSNIQRIDCESCSKGKLTRKSFPSSTRPRANQTGERVHVDLCGPIGTPTISGNIYIVLFKDEYSNYRHGHFVKTKDKVYDCIRKTIADIEADTKKKVLRLVSDRGSEIISNRTKDYLLSRGISQELSAPHTPEQNGFIERDNRTIIEAARTMLQHKNLPEKLWGEAVNTAIYIINRTINKNTIDQTPFEKYFGRKPEMRHIRVFGSLAMMKLQEKKRSGYQKKLEARSIPTTLVGYERNFTYRVYNNQTDEIVITRQVDVDETKTATNQGERLSYNELELFITPYNNESEEIEPDTENGAPLMQEEVIPDPPDQETNDEESEELVNLEDPVTAEGQDTSEPVTNNEVPILPQAGLSPPVPPRSTSLAPRPRSPYKLRKRGDANCTEACISMVEEPSTYEEAIASLEKEKWVQAMKEEYQSHVTNNTWTLVEPPKGRKPIRGKWVYKIKPSFNDHEPRYKARYVIKGFSQKPGLDYTETFAPVAGRESIRLILSIATEEDLDIIHFDVKTAFLNSILEEEIYMEQPIGYQKDSNKVCKLNKALYGLKQASRAWNNCFTNFLKEFNLEPLKKDSCVFMNKINQTNRERLIICIYVDDGMICCQNSNLMKRVTEHLKKKFEITIMDPKCYVGFEIQRDKKNRSMFVTQTAYLLRVLERFEMSNAKAVTTPMQVGQKLCKNGIDDGEIHKKVNVPYREAVGALNYLSTGTRPDISFSVSVVARFCEEPRMPHWNAIKRVMAYLNATRDLGLFYHKTDTSGLLCAVDSDYAGDIDTRKSTSGLVLLHYGAPISWKSSKQTTVATSTTEAEIVAASAACREIIWARLFLQELKRKPPVATPLEVDNQGAISLIINNQIHSKIKHMQIKHLFAREAHENKEVELRYVPTENQIADPLTKALPTERFNNLITNMGMSKKKNELKMSKAISKATMLSTLGMLTMCLIMKVDTANIATEHVVALHYTSPCEMVVKEEDQWNGSAYRYGCMSQYETWLKSIDIAADCAPPARYKRSLSTAVKVIITAATNLLLAKMREKAADRDKIMDDLNRSLNLKGMYTDTIDDYVSLSSESYNNHRDVLNGMKNRVPYFFWLWIRVHSEIVTNTANMLTMQSYCKEGKVATKELGELVGNRELGLINPENTQLRSIEKGPEDVITFRFISYKQSNNTSTEEDNKSTEGAFSFKFMLIFSFSIVSFTITIVAFIYWRLHVKGKETVQPPEPMNRKRVVPERLNLESEYSLPRG